MATYIFDKSCKNDNIQENCNNPTWKCFLSKIFCTCTHRCEMQCGMSTTVWYWLWMDWTFDCIGNTGLGHLNTIYSRFSPDCTLHAAISHVISVLERWRLTHDYTIGIHVRLHHSNTFITWVIAECNVQSGLETLGLRRLYFITCQVRRIDIHPSWGLLLHFYADPYNQFCRNLFILTLYLLNMAEHMQSCIEIDWVTGLYNQNW